MSNPKVVIHEPVFIEDAGRRVAVILPIAVYEALCAKANGGIMPAPAKTEGNAGFERERAAFERLKPELLKQYPERVVAVVGGQVVEIGDDELEVFDRVHARFGNISMYVQKVTEHPRVYHIPFRKVISA